MVDDRSRKPFSIILLLILSGEAIFILPFVLARVFRPTFLEVFAINNYEIGSCFSVYGVVALISYLFGGPLADAFKPRILMSLALVLTALGGFYMSSYPDYEQLLWLFGYFGFTTIFLFWSAMIKATRIWGGDKNQGLAFGFLDGGRGLVAAAFGTLGVLVFSMFITGDISESSLSERQYAFGRVLLTSSILVLAIGILVFFFLKQDASPKHQDTNDEAFNLKDLVHILKIPSVWLLMLIILCAYFGYKMTDFFSQYANEVMLYDEISSAKVGTSLLYLRPLIGITIGFLADRSRASFWLMVGFILILLSSILIASGIIDNSTTLLFMVAMISMAIGVYAARVLYFAAFEEGHIPIKFMGTAVGLVSVIGFTPDIFAGPLTGILLDDSPGEIGFQHVFMILAIFSIIGLVAAFLFHRFAKRKESIS